MKFFLGGKYLKLLTFAWEIGLCGIGKREEDVAQYGQIKGYLFTPKAKF